ncbi:hypothetical protein C2G38_2211322 [Gigaspora rosea]|uniref:Uncharacterized protein n=1 Tax=Gigaspora rosea TaxID=44941 RepID=A0A397UEI6_9GLOM|nr:hypothetical protein C2G38_2211322 [Gigaspora rosea]
MSFKSQSTNNLRPQYFSHLAVTRRIKLKLKYIRPEHLFEQYYSFLVKPEDLEETRYIKKNKRKESIKSLYQKLEKLKSDLKAELFELALKYKSKNKETLTQPEKEKQERLQTSYIKFLEELYEKQVGFWIANQYTIAETYEKLEKYYEQYWERKPISILEQPLQ